ncbi:hypothetical protein GCM10011297_16030 [Bacterioplanes sanyensis]|uniref:hypothetical protein n=1 Tax=Bacterioplanes sanyensis TaxID=1249553 RepID=UPI0016741213|nr:hypothetical protein [Bacterioplanes sanyensis]GGY43920.1 hypothetical protein GCM10011297_16030 [Bacterioplanes sanyensis]
MDSARYATLWRFLLVFQSGAVTVVALLLLVLLGIMEYYSNHDVEVLIWLLAYSPLILLLTIAWPIWQLSLFSRGRYGHPAILLWLLLQLVFVPLGTLAAIVQMVCLFHLTSKEST